MSQHDDEQAQSMPRERAVFFDADLGAIAYAIDRDRLDYASASALLTIAAELRLIRERFHAVASETYGIWTNDASKL